MKKYLLFPALLFFLFSVSSCSQKASLTYLALGDSYTIGEAVDENLRWPNILADSLQSEGVNIHQPKIIATTGWTTDELMEALEKENPNNNYNIVSLLIGVNNQYRSYPVEQYKKEFKILLDKAIEYAAGKPERVFVVSIPNYGVTPFGISRGEEKIRQELLIYDAIADSIASDSGIPFINITPISEKAKSDASYIAVDELHPSGKQYQEWVELIYPVSEEILNNSSNR